MSDVLQLRARVAALTRHRPDDTDSITDARLRLRAAKLEEHITRVIAEAPPLTREQRDRLALILRGGDAA